MSKLHCERRVYVRLEPKCPTKTSKSSIGSGQEIKFRNQAKGVTTQDNLVKSE